MRTRQRFAAAGLFFAALISGSCGEQQRFPPVGDVGQTEPPDVPTGETPVPTVENPTPQTPTPPSQPENPGDTLNPPGPTAPEQPTAGPWPIDAMKNYSVDFAVGTPQSVALDEGLNLWLLAGDRIGVL